MWLIEALRGLFGKDELRKVVYEVTAPAFLSLVAHYKPLVLIVSGSIGHDYSSSRYSFQTEKSWFVTDVIFSLWTEDIFKTKGDIRLTRIEEEFFKALRTYSRNGIVLEPHKLILKEAF